MCCISISQWFENNFVCAFLFSLTFVFTRNLCVQNLGKNGTLKETNVTKWTRPTRNWTLGANLTRNQVQIGFFKYIIGLYLNLNPFWGQPDLIRPIFLLRPQPDLKFWSTWSGCTKNRAVLDGTKENCIKFGFYEKATKYEKDLGHTFDKSVVFCAHNSVLAKKLTKIFQNKCGQVILYKP